MVMQQSPFIIKCTRTCGGWSIFTEKCTPDVTFTPIRNPYTYVQVHTFAKNEKDYYIENASA